MEPNYCSLCDGKIVNGRCRNCGMRYGKVEGRYYLNQSRKGQKNYIESRGWVPNRVKILKRIKAVGKMVLIFIVLGLQLYPPKSCAQKTQPEAAIENQTDGCKTLPESSEEYFTEQE